MLLRYSRYVLRFASPAGTSRGVLNEKVTYFLSLTDNDGISGYGEVPIFPGLSKESEDDLLRDLKDASSAFQNGEIPVRAKCSSLTFGLESALRDLKNGGVGIYFPSVFLSGRSSIQINGLVWMGDFAQMKERILTKIKDGFKCIKIKIGAIGWDEEINLISMIRRSFGDGLEIRVDANGAFSYDECMPKLEKLAKLGIHSIEQPLPAGKWEDMRKLCASSPLPIALDEELIGIPVDNQRDDLLDFIRPQYIILKPALCFGFSGSSDWINRAVKRNIGWWVTSALESSVGLDTIAQFVGTLEPQMPQGLGTGGLYVNNLPSPIKLDGQDLTFAGPSDIFRSSLRQLTWR